MIVASWNIHKCRGPDGACRPDRVARVIGEFGADLVALQEVDRKRSDRPGLLDEDHLSELGLTLLGQSDHPRGHGWHGNAILIRGRPVSYTRRRLALPGMEPRGAVVADIDFGHSKLRIVAAHLGLLGYNRSRQAGAILSALAKYEPLPTVLLGDLNEWRAQGSALGVLAPLFGKPEARPSFPSRMPMLSLDRIMAWPPGMLSGIEVHDTPGAREASDHLPIKAVIDAAAAVLPYHYEPAAEPPGYAVR